MKKLRCRPGDLAVIVGVTFPKNRSVIGQIVEVLELGVLDSCWECAAVGFRFPQKSFLPVFSHGAKAEIRDCCLRPLRGNPDEQAEREREVVE